MKNKDTFVVRTDPDLREGVVHIEDALDLAGYGRYNYILLLACCITHLGSVVDMLGFSIVAPDASCDLQISLEENTILTSVSFAGFMFALPWGYFADTRGRRTAILISSSVGFTIAVINSFSTSYLMMVILKFIGCSFSTACLTLTTTFLGESVPTRHMKSAIFIQNCFCLAADFVCFGLAYIFLPMRFNLPLWSTLTLKPWRLLSLISALPLGIGALMMLFLHESPKFLANKGETIKALEVLKSTYVVNGGCEDSFPVRALVATVKREENISFWDTVVTQTVLIFKPPLLWRTLQLFYLFAICCSMNNVFFMWFPTMVNSFYSSADDGDGKNFCDRVITNISTKVTDGNDPCNNNTPINTIYAGMLFTIFIVIVNVAVVRLSSWRKLLLIATFVISGCGTAFVNSFEDPIVTVILFSLIQFTGICVGIVGSYFVDVYPTSYRGLASSLGMMVARFACLGGINLIGALVVDHCQIIFYGWTLFVLSGVIAALFLPSDVKNNKQ